MSVAVPKVVEPSRNVTEPVGAPLSGRGRFDLGGEGDRLTENGRIRGGGDGRCAALLRHEYNAGIRISRLEGHGPRDRELVYVGEGAAHGIGAGDRERLAERRRKTGQQADAERAGEGRLPGDLELVVLSAGGRAADLDARGSREGVWV